MKTPDEPQPQANARNSKTFRRRKLFSAQRQRKKGIWGYLPHIKLPKTKLKLIRKDPFGNIIILKRALIGLAGLATYSRFNIINQMKVVGAEHLLDLPTKNVLFISNHQTYYADVMALYHIFCSVKWRFTNINLPIYLFLPRVKTFYVAAEETMLQSGWLPRILSYAGAVTVRRSWRAAGEEVQRGADRNAPDKIKQALEYGWVVTFPQGTTKAFAPVRKGAAHLIHQFKPIVVPVEIDGFRRAFDKKGLFFKKRGVQLSVTFKKPLQFTEEHSIADIQAFIEKHVGINKAPQTLPHQQKKFGVA
ncbi:lysophospholipid acyltransferase family protein [Hugenholtzia roseola]|uniref:lysophospholipid acyltransferase family protein n=1 Tax=Hugenholtzia roseola TaxID=1002 RepID=UPI00040DE81A|nr:lysophospholipid acyltransferase family protein [Hugenholtzia roseola]